jgi:2'-5' RNA ligase
LYDALWGRLEERGWERPPGVFRPHVSLLRKAQPGDVSVLQRPPLTWTPAGCVLVASQPREGGSHYQVLARMPLRVA